MYDIVNTSEYRDYSINTGYCNEYYCYTDTLDQIIDTLEYMVKNHSKVLCCLLVIKLPQESNLNIREKMTRILENIKRKIIAKHRFSLHNVEMKYVWRAERNMAKHEHVHLAIMVNGNAIQNSWGIHAIAREVVKSHFNSYKDGLVEYCSSNGKYGKMIDRNSPDFYAQMDDAVYAMSYIAKARANDNKNKYARLSSASRLPR